MLRSVPFKMISTVIALLVSFAILFAVGRVMGQIDERSRQAGLETARDAIERTVRQCYALEGTYPPSLAYLEEHYGLTVSRERYTVYYEVVAGNLPPIIDIRLAETPFEVVATDGIGADDET